MLSFSLKKQVSLRRNEGFRTFFGNKFSIRKLSFIPPHLTSEALFIASRSISDLFLIFSIFEASQVILQGKKDNQKKYHKSFFSALAELP